MILYPELIQKSWVADRSPEYTTAVLPEIGDNFRAHLACLLCLDSQSHADGPPIMRWLLLKIFSY